MSFSAAQTAGASYTCTAGDFVEPTSHAFRVQNMFALTNLPVKPLVAFYYFTALLRP